jgi:hypothetical protein
MITKSWQDVVVEATVAPPAGPPPSWSAHANMGYTCGSSEFKGTAKMKTDSTSGCEDAAKAMLRCCVEFKAAAGRKNARSDRLRGSWRVENTKEFCWRRLRCARAAKACVTSKLYATRAASCVHSGGGWSRRRAAEEAARSRAHICAGATERCG